MRFQLDRKEAILVLMAWFGLAAGNAESSPKIRVRIIDDTSTVEVRGFDLKIRSLATHDLKLQQASALRAGRSLPVLTAKSDRLSRWKLACPSGGVVEAKQIGQHSPYPLQTFYFAGPVSIDSPSGFISVAEKAYREQIWIHPVRDSNGNWECEVVNHVDVETYLDGLVNAEFSARWSPEAIDSQVIAARTYAAYQMRLMAKKGSHYDLDSTTKDQVYDGSTKEDYRSRLSALRTRGLVLKANANDEWPIKAYYHSTCGGVTELPEVVWGNPMKGFRKRVACGKCTSSPRYIWDVPLSTQEIVKEWISGAKKSTRVQRESLWGWPLRWEEALQKSELVDLKVSQVNASGRAEWIRSKWKNSEGKFFDLVLPGTLFRSWMGPSRLKSTVFQILSAGKDQWVLRGKGFGHGVGLCQWGAKTLGEQGKSARAILKYYYPNAVLARAW